jgi:hypothetical protein
MARRAFRKMTRIALIRLQSFAHGLVSALDIDSDERYGNRCDAYPGTRGRSLAREPVGSGDGVG